MESQPQNPECRNNPENFQPCAHIHEIWVCMTAETKIINSIVIYRGHFSTQFYDISALIKSKCILHLHLPPLTKNMSNVFKVTSCCLVR